MQTFSEVLTLSLNKKQVIDCLIEDILYYDFKKGYKLDIINSKILKDVKVNSINIVDLQYVFDAESDDTLDFVEFHNKITDEINFLSMEKMSNDIKEVFNIYLKERKLKFDTVLRSYPNYLEFKEFLKNSKYNDDFCKTDNEIRMKFDSLIRDKIETVLPKDNSYFIHILSKLALINFRWIDHE